MRDKLGGKVMKEFATLRPKAYNNNEDKSANFTKKCIIKR